jgi:hypothetical protein
MITFFSVTTEHSIGFDGLELAVEEADEEEVVVVVVAFL